MKQVTMESVKQRIADLESAGKVVCGLSLSSEFELACLRELVAVTEQRDSLVVKNATLREAAEFAIAPDMWEELGGNVLRYQYQEWYADKLKAALASTATDAARASLRAEGVEMLLTENFKAEIAAALADFDGVDDATLQTVIWSGQPPEPDGDVWHIEYMTRGYQVQKKIREFARQLRESKGEASNG